MSEQPNPMQQMIAKIEEELNGSLFFQGFTQGIDNQPNVPVPFPGESDPNKVGGVHMYNTIRRFSLTMQPGNKMGAVVCGQNAAITHTQRWVVVPDNYHAYPSQVPPATLFDRYKSQRFMMMDDVFDFGKGNTFTAFGTGRTFPKVVNGANVLSVGGTGKFTGGTGLFEGAWGAYVINGYITEDNQIKFQICVRVLNPKPGFQADKSAGVSSAGDLAPGSTYLCFLGEADRAGYKDPIAQKFEGKDMVGATVHELLRPVNVNTWMANQGIQVFLEKGEVCATLATSLNFRPRFDDPILGSIVKPLPWGTSGTVITFRDKAGAIIGTLSTNVAEGFGFVHKKTQLDIFFQLLGYGPIDGGTGIFEGVSGLMSVSAAVTVFPPALSNLYTFRFDDPEGKLRDALRAIY